MKLRDVGLSLLGSTMVYVAMAACSSGGGSSGGIATKGFGSGGGAAGGSTASVGTTGGASGASGAGSSGAGPHDSGIFDALTHPVPDAAASPTDGTRLKATYRVADDGSKEYVSGIWFDSTRNEQCTFAPAGDGKTRCLPTAATAQIYSDSMCTMPLLSVATGCSAPTYAQTVLAAAQCSTVVGGTHIYAVGASTTPAGIYVQAGASCYSAGTGATGFTYYKIGAEVPANSFVSATTGHD